MIEKIKMLTLRALVSDSKLLYGLVLKGGNALQLAYNITDRASMDIDFSIQDDFSPEEILRLKSIFLGLLTNEFEPEELVVIDVNFKEKPKNSIVKEWKGYVLDFKVIPFAKYNPNDINKSRNAAIKYGGGQSSPKFEVEISSYEYTLPKKKFEREGTIFYAYTPEMIVMEKMRALCQSLPEYQETVPTANQKARARDFYDIWNICQNFKIDFTSEVNKKMFIEIFKAKKVKLELTDLLRKYKDYQEGNWISVIDTLSTENVKSFDFHFDFVEDKIKLLKTP